MPLPPTPNPAWPEHFLAHRAGHDCPTRVNASPEESDGACYTDAPGLSDRAHTNRATPGRALAAAGTVPYRTERWHWSFGDWYWALLTQRPAALYGPVELS